MSQLRIIFQKTKLKWKVSSSSRKFASIDFLTGSSDNSEEHKMTKTIRTTGEPSLSLFDSMAENAMRNSDSITLNKIIEQSTEIATNVDQSVEKALLFYMWEKDYSSAVNVLKIVDPNKVRISEVTCQHLMTEILDQMQWNSAYIVVSHMVLHDYHVSDRDMSYIVAGLMGTTEGMAKSLCLLQLIVEKRRSDLARNFLYHQVTSFSVNAGSPYRDVRPLPVHSLETAMRAVVTAIREDGWFSFSICKVLVAVSCAVNHRSLAVDFIRLTLDTIQSIQSNEQNNTTSSTRGLLLGHSDDSQLSLLSTLTAFAEGDGLAQRISYNLSSRIRGYSEVTLNILDSLVYRLPHMHLVSGARESPRLIGEFLSAYWTLAFRCKLAAVSSQSTGSVLSSDTIDAVHTRQMTIYSALVSFLFQSRIQHEEFKPASSFDRRNLRYMSDELGLLHRTSYTRDTATNSDQYTVTLSKPVGHSTRGSDWVEPPSFAEVVRDDSTRPENLRRFEGEPLHWPLVRDFLLRLSDDTLAMVCIALLKNMLNYCSASWAFLIIDLMRQRDIPVPAKTFSVIISMCKETNDVYGIIELLHLAKMERTRLNEDDVYRQRQISMHRKIDSAVSCDQDETDLVRTSLTTVRDGLGWNDDLLAGPHLTDDDGMVQSNRKYRVVDPSYYKLNEGQDGSAVDVLTRNDWNRAVLVAFHSRNSRISHDSYKSAFTEVMRMMRECGVSLESGTMYSLLRFLVTTNANEDMFLKLVGRIARDESYTVSLVECLSMTMYLNKKIFQYPFHYTSPRFTQQNYLTVHPGSMSKAVQSFVDATLRMGEESIRPFEAIYSQTNTAAGREALFFYLSDLVQDGIAGKRRQIVSDHAAMEAVSIMCIYSAYLVAAHDGEFRHAFNMLYEMQVLFQEHMEQNERGRF